MNKAWVFTAVVSALGFWNPALEAAPRKAKPLETYSSMEPEAPVPTPATVTKVDSSKTARPPQLPPTHKFDAVPDSLKDPLKERLALVESLVIRHGRAYDYRALTIAQLKEILASLESKKAASEIPADAE